MFADTSEPANDEHPPSTLRRPSMSGSASDVTKTIDNSRFESGGHADDVIDLYTDDDGENDADDEVWNSAEERKPNQRLHSARIRNSAFTFQSMPTTDTIPGSARLTERHKVSDSHVTNSESASIDILEATEILNILNHFTEDHHAPNKTDVEDAERSPDAGGIETETVTDGNQSPRRLTGKSFPVPALRKERNKNGQTSAGKRKSNKVGTIEQTSIGPEATSNEDDEVDRNEEEYDQKAPSALPKTRSCTKSSRKKRKRKSNLSNGKVHQKPTNSERRKQGNGEFQLGTCENPDVKDWLRKKNRQLRRQKTEERRREKQQKKAEAERINQNEKKRPGVCGESCCVDET